ncbi:MAG: valine--tRNA ligase [Leptospiraceae bacterium]|nr:valine--tRNA ligase [Leptospiraceae bacterium]MCP5498461.1 valine--tRNA ligase [Leptospiraceae bacterium]
MKKEISDRYKPEDVEKKWISLWEEKKAFAPDFSKEENYCIVIPPPNVTGTLHIGHALNHTLQDILTRIERKKGKSTLWLPGTDHAGIATQMVVERELAKEGKSRYDFSREEFEKKVWEWKHKSGGQITHQQRMLGESVDWARERFTLDEGLSKAVVKAFKKLYEEGLIYRGERIINWCPSTRTAISDIEVEYRETKSFLYHIRYPIKGTKDYIVVATTRPETMLGDVAVCAHPEDERYKDKEGMVLELPLTGRDIPLLFDSFVEKEFGTGLVKITPAHDPNDYEASQRLNLKPINIMHPDGSLNEKAGAYEGLDRFVARKKIVEDLQKQGLIEKIEDYVNSVGHNQRGGAVIEPYLSTQWFVDVKAMARDAIDVVKDGRIEFIPKMWEKTYFEWMENIRDWCISRQLWWGHRIPAYYLPDGSMVVAESLEEAIQEFKKQGKSFQESEVRQDNDVLDTWFSSGLWPFSTLGWPEETPDLKRFYPNSILVTAFDIIFFWVARMIMFGMKMMGDVPFRKVLIHGLVRDSEGKKFSKSKGNTVDPLEMMERYGTDSFRFFLTATMPEGRDVIFDESRLEGYRAFCNKIWNSSRFILMNLPEDYDAPLHLEPKKLESTDKWILNRLNECLETYEKAYASYRFYEMASSLYDFIWRDFCDWYIELSKPRIYGKITKESQETARDVLVYVLRKALDLLHPFMPFITEEINSVFSSELLTNSPWLQKFLIDKEDEGVRKINFLQEIVSCIRVTRGELGITPDKKCSLIIDSSDELVKKVLEEEKVSILQLARAESLEYKPGYTPQKTDSLSPFSKGQVILPLSGLIDFDKEKARLEKEKGKLEGEIERAKKKLENPNFIEKANPDVIQKEKEKLELLEEKLGVVVKGFEKIGVSV